MTTELKAMRKPSGHKEWSCERIGKPQTVGELRRMLRGIAGGTEFGFRNQQSQSLFVLWQDGNLSVVFQ